MGPSYEGYCHCRNAVCFHNSEGLEVRYMLIFALAASKTLSAATLSDPGSGGMR
ncbi:MAG: hypothetical protein ACP5N0_11535 [Methanosarcina sp.]|uniref:hypothetical protein n=1 Tax=Methanosarcina sp. TaxID=2213 RepID=UPI003BB619FC